MREIVHLQVGQCGNQLGVKFWEVVCDEHSIDSEGKFCGFSPLQIDKINVFFTCCNKDRYVPRAILVDLETSVLGAIRNSDAGLLFKPDNYIYCTSGGANNWAKGHYSNGAEIIDAVMEIVRKETEQAECLQGFQMVHSLGGGTGSGLGTLIISKIREEYPDKLVNTHSVIPTPRVSNVIVEPYNTVLSFNEMIETTDETCFYDNEALCNICLNKLALRNPVFGDLNHLISSALSGVTTCLRFPGQLNADLRKLAVNMVPFPRLHFFATSFAPLIPRNLKDYQSSTNIQQLTEEVFDVNSMMVACDPSQGMYLTVATIFRGAVCMKEVEENISNIQHKNESHFVSWIPNNFKAAVCDIPNRDVPISIISLSNTTSIRRVFEREANRFAIMLEKKAFIHWYTAEGMEEAEFYEAEKNLQQLIAEYEQYEQLDGYSTPRSDYTSTTTSMSLASDTERLNFKSDKSITMRPFEPTTLLKFENTKKNSGNKRGPRKQSLVNEHILSPLTPLISEHKNPLRERNREQLHTYTPSLPPPSSQTIIAYNEQEGKIQNTNKTTEMFNLEHQRENTVPVEKHSKELVVNKNAQSTGIPQNDHVLKQFTTGHTTTQSKYNEPNRRNMDQTDSQDVQYKEQQQKQLTSHTTSRTDGARPTHQTAFQNIPYKDQQQRQPTSHTTCHTDGARPTQQAGFQDVQHKEHQKVSVTNHTTSHAHSAQPTHQVGSENVQYTEQPLKPFRNHTTSRGSVRPMQEPHELQTESNKYNIPFEEECVRYPELKYDDQDEEDSESFQSEDTTIQTQEVPVKKKLPETDKKYGPHNEKQKDETDL